MFYIQSSTVECFTNTLRISSCESFKRTGSEEWLVHESLDYNQLNGFESDQPKQSDFCRLSELSHSLVAQTLMYISVWMLRREMGCLWGSLHNWELESCQVHLSALSLSFSRPTWWIKQKSKMCSRFVHESLNPLIFNDLCSVIWPMLR